VETSLDNKLNVSYFEPDGTPASISCVLRHCAASIVIYGALLAFMLTNPWYSSLLRCSIGSMTGALFYVWLYVIYVVVSPVVYLVFRPAALRASKNVMIMGYLGRLLGRLLGRRSNSSGDWRPTYHERHALMFLLIKLIYGPMMVNSVCYGVGKVGYWLPFLGRNTPWINTLDVGYTIFVAAIFLLDSSLFCFGYHAEAGFLRNRVRYVETSLFGLTVCLMCYPPFNEVTTHFFGQSNNTESILFRGDLTHPITWILRAMAVFFLLMLISSSLSLFTRASNLTNRGIVTWGTYSIVRHPGYTAKNLFWLTTIVPLFFNINPSAPFFTWTGYALFCLSTIGGFIAWSTIYCLRALTEEKLLMKDPEYVAYCKKVRWRFIPGLV
jgi:protein-S-isoprenylcysteine O-methyltransferase Ste14